ncbi:MAG: DUF5995 family protein [Phototrophicaceae bacterium]
MTLYANNIDEVVTIMDDILHTSMADESRLGYFAALYRTVTIVVRDECNLGLFEDNERMRRLDTIFANRYFAAYDSYHKQIGMPSDAWNASFEVCQDNKLLILQHLLLGMHAHIALDLGIATAEIADGDLSESLQRDFYRLNHILTTLIDVVQKEIAEASPFIRYLDKWAWRADETFVSYSIDIARDDALNFAQQLIQLPRSQWEGAIRTRDNAVANISRQIICYTGFPFNIAIWLINLRENKNPRSVTEMMSNEKWQATVAQRVEHLVEEAVAQGLDLGKRDTQVMQIPQEIRE